MSLITIPNTFSAGAVIIASQHNSNFSTISTDYNGNITDANIASGAGIKASKLDLSTPPAIGATSPNTGAFTTISSTGLASLNSLLIGSVHQGDVLYDNGTSIVRLPPGTSGNVLQTQGASANPQWGTLSWIPNNIQVFTNSGTWTKPANVSTVYVKVIGGGGAGGNDTSGHTLSAGGGGGGGYAEGLIAVTGNVTVTIGATNSFAGSTTISATSGSAGGNSPASGSGASGGAGGTGSNGTINITGSTGQGGSSSNGGAGGNGGGTVMGPGGGGGQHSTSGGSGSAGGSYGGGGGGAGSSGSGTGGAGDAGAVIVYY